jgi:exonuclease VII small subunit
VLQDYPGNYEDYLWQKERRGAEPAGSSGKAEAREAGASKEHAEQEKRTKRPNPISIRKMEKNRDELEEEISRCETEITSLELELGNFKSAEESIRVAALIDERRTLLKEMTERWERLVATLERERPADESEIPSSKMD